MVDEKTKLGETTSKTPLEEFISAPVDGKLKDKVVDRTVRQLREPGFSAELLALQQLLKLAEEHKLAKQNRINERNAGGGDQDAINELNENDQEVIDSLNELIQEVNTKLTALEASSKIDGRVGAVLEVMKKKGDVTPGAEKAARIIALLAEGVSSNSDELFAQAAEMMQQMFAQAGSEKLTKEVDKQPEGRTVAEAVEIINANIALIQFKFGKRFTPDYVTTYGKLIDGSLPIWRAPIIYMREIFGREKDAHTRLMNMAEFAEKFAKEKAVNKVFSELRMGEMNDLLPKYKNEIEDEGIDGINKTFIDKQGGKHPLRNMVRAHLLVMVDLGLIKKQDWMEDEDGEADAARNKVIERLGETHSDQLLEYYKRRLKTVTDAFPSVKLDGDETTSDKLRRKRVEKIDETDDKKAVDSAKKEDEKDTVSSINLEQAMMTLGLMEGKDDTKPDAELTRWMNGNMETTFNQNTFNSLVEAVRTAPANERKAKVKAGLKTIIKPGLVALGKTRAGQDVKTPTPFDKKATEEGIKLFVSLMDTAS